jgi:hypothetical protein
MSSPVQNWFETMRQIWLERRSDDIGALLSDEGFEFYEHPFDDRPLTTKQGVIDVWQEIRGQDIEYVKIKILYETGTVGVAEWRFKIVDEPLHIGSYF